MLFRKTIRFLCHFFLKMSKFECLVAVRFPLVEMSGLEPLSEQPNKMLSTRLFQFQIPIRNLTEQTS